MKKVTWQRLAAAALAVLVWQAASMAVGSALLLPSPAAVLVRLAALLPDGGFWRAVWFSFCRIAGGFGAALPLLNFPFGLLGSLAVLLMPEITQAHIEGQTARLNALLDRMLRLTGYFSMLAGTLFWVWGRPLAQLLYHSPEAGFYLETLAPAMPLMYLESMVDGAMKGIGEQKAAFRYSVWDAVLRIGGVAVLLPRYGMRGFLTVILLSSFYTCAANTGRLLLSSGTGHAFRRWLGAPLLAAVAAGAAGYGNAAVTVWVGGSGNDLPLQNVLLVKGGESNADKTQVGRISAAGDGHLRRRGLPLSFVQTEQPRRRRGRLSGSLSPAAAGRHRFPRHRAPESMAAARNAQPVRRSSPVGVV